MTASFGSGSGGLPLNGATSQLDREAGAPKPAQAPLDGRDLGTLLAFSAEYGALINFYDLSDSVDGDWTIFFASDPTIALALLSSLNLPALEATMLRDIRELGRKAGWEEGRPGLNRLLALFARLARMLDHGQGTPWADGMLSRTIRREIRVDLAPGLAHLARHLGEGGAGLGEGFAALSGVWAVAPEGRSGPAAAHPHHKTGDHAWRRELVQRLERFADALVATLARVIDDAARALEASLTSQRHAPQAALYIAFATLFQHAQRNANAFAARLVDFYDEAVLRQHDREAVPDHLYLTFTTDQGTDQAAVPAGTRFPAGTDPDGQAIDYAAAAGLTALGVTVAELRTLQVARVPDSGTFSSASPAASPAAGAAGTGKAGVYTGTVALSEQAPAIASPFPLFGTTVAGSDGVLTTAAATLGFAVSSDTLMLTAGTRTVRVVLSVAPESLAAIQGTLQEIADGAGIDDTATVLAQILQKAFTLYYSTGGGWVAVAAFTVTAGDAAADAGTTSGWSGGEWDLSPAGSGGGGPDAPGSTAFVLSFTLGDQDDPVVAMSTTPPSADAVPPTPATPAPAEDLPTLLAVFSQDPVMVEGGGATVAVYPYAVLSDVRLSGVAVAVAVEGFTGLTLSGPNGPIDASTPFAPFGSPPVQGATLAMAAAELFVKRLDDLDVRLSWYGIPATSTGFKGYYQGYVVDPDGDEVPPGTLFTNQSFLGAFSVRAPGWWTLAPASGDSGGDFGGWSGGDSGGGSGGSGGGSSFLFRTSPDSDIPDPDQPVLADSGFAGLPVTASLPPPSYDPTTGALCLTLADPPYAFGDTLYASNVMAAALREMPDAAACEQACARRNAPLGQVAGAAEQLAPVVAANRGASDQDYASHLSAALEQALAGLSGTVVGLLESWFDGQDPTTAAAWRSSLDQALSQASGGGRRSMLGGLNGKRSKPGAADVCAALGQWIDGNAAAMEAASGGSGAVVVGQARVVLNAATQTSAAVSATAGQTPAAARPKLAASLASVRSRLTRPYSDAMRDCIAACQGSSIDKYYPNQPWLPTLASVTLDYSATDRVPGGTGATYSHVVPFGGTRAVPWKEGATVSLLAPVTEDGALYIGLEGTAAADGPVLTLLAQLTGAVPGGGARTPRVAWSMATATGWEALPPPEGLQGDGTDGMRHTGIVTLGTAGLTPTVDGLAWLRVSVREKADRFPLLAALAPNALTADWVGPGGAAGLDTPLPAGTITGSDPALDGIAAVDQPLPSTGGRAQAVGPSYRTWMAERLHHKNRGVQHWDYARLVLADYPTLWQVAVVAAGEGPDPTPPGSVRLVLVAGPTMPDIADPTTPFATDEVLGSVLEAVRPRISPFAALTVENPIYVRVQVTTSVIFRDVSTAAELSERLEADLVRWLSPWPPVGLGRRPAVYWSKSAVADFIRQRLYVAEVLTLSLARDPADGVTGCHYVTSATTHRVIGATASTKRLRVAGPGAGGADEDVWA